MGIVSYMYSLWFASMQIDKIVKFWKSVWLLLNEIGFNKVENFLIRTEYFRILKAF